MEAFDLTKLDRVTKMYRVGLITAQELADGLQSVVWQIEIERGIDMLERYAQPLDIDY